MEVVIEIKNGKVKVKDYAKYRRFMHLMASEIEQGKGGIETFGSSGVCEEVCEEHGGVRICGEEFALCNDGTGILLP